MSKLFWYISHSFRRYCPDGDIQTIVGNWNESFSHHFTPKHTCKKCGREWIRGIVYPDEPWPKPPQIKMKKKQKYYITFDPKELIIWGCGLSKDGSMSNASLNLLEQHCVTKTKTIVCGETFFESILSDGHCQEITWAIVNGEPEFITDDSFLENILSPKFKKKTFTIERPR